MLADGSLMNQRAEMLAILLADGFEAGEAWKAAGGSSTPSSARYRENNLTDRTFKARLEGLMTEKAEIERAGGAYADAKWAAKQSYRVAALKSDHVIMAKQADLLFKIAQSEGGGPAVVETTPGKVGKPSIEAPSNGKRNPEAIRAALMRKGTEAADPRATRGQDDDD